MDVRILVVDDSEVVVESICLLLKTQKDFKVIGTAANGFEAIRRAKELKPDVILLDIELPGMRGTEAAREIREVAPTCKILFLSLDDSAPVVREALESGGAGYVVKTEACKELRAAVRTIVAGGWYLSASCRRMGLEFPKDRESGLHPAVVSQANVPNSVE